MMKKVLIIDDDPNARLHHTTIHEGLCVKFLVTVDGEEGLLNVYNERCGFGHQHLMIPKKGDLRVSNELKEL